MFTKGSGASFVTLLVYADDIILVGPNVELIDSVRRYLHKFFKLKDLGILKYFLGFEVACNKIGMSVS